MSKHHGTTWIREIEYSVMGLMVLFMLVYGWTQQVHASSGINSYESRVLAVVQSVFKYQGHYYRAKAEYISQVSAYLDDDDVDLTASQANTVISRIYASIPDGVSGGYLYEIQISTTEDASTEDTSTEESADEDATEDTSDSSEDTETTTEEVSTEPEGVIVIDDILAEATTEVESEFEYNVWEEVIGYENFDDGDLGDRPEEEESGTKLIYDDETGELVFVSDHDTTSLSNAKYILPSYVRVTVYVLCGICIVATLASAVILAVYRCFIWKKHKKRGKRKGHSKRRRIRKIIRNVFTVTGTIEVLLLFLGVIVWLGLYRQDSTMTNLNTSGYFRYAYNAYCDDETNEPMEYEKFLFEAKKEITSTLNGKEVTDSVLYASVASSLYQLQQELKSCFGYVLLASLLCLIVTIVMLIYMDGIRYRGERRIAIIAAGSGFLTLLASVVLSITQPYVGIYIEPDYLYLFVHETGDWMNQVMYIVSAFGIAVSLLLFVTYRSMRKNDDNT